MDNIFYMILICGLVVWRISSLLVNETGPFDIFENIRFYSGVRYNEIGTYGINFISKILSCVWCMSVWVSAPIAYLALLVLNDVNFRTIIWVFLALSSSAVAILIEEIVQALGKGQVR